MACEPIRIMAAAPECPLACQAVAIPNWNRFAGREPAARHNRLRIGEHLCGTLITDDLAKESDDRRIRSDPSRCTVNARDFLEHLQGGNGIHLQSAVCLGHPRTHDPCIMKRSHRLRRQPRSEEHTSELQSLAYLVCRLLLEKKKKKTIHVISINAI